MPHETVAPGVHLIADPVVNFYLVEDDEGVTAIDAGLPGDWKHLLEGLRAIGREGQLRAVVLTHGHVDHVGFAERARRELNAHVFVPEGEQELAAAPLARMYPLAERSPLPYLNRSATRRLLLTVLLMGGAKARVGGDMATYAAGEELPVPGRPRAIASPGHTPAHMALLLADRDVLFTGDAIVTLDPYTGRRGPRLVARAATHDVDQNLRSLAALERTGAQILLPGHGRPWTEGAQKAVVLAREAGSA